MALKDITDKVAPVWQALKGIATGSKIISSEWNAVIENVAERTQFLRRRGICDWDSTLSYAVGDFVQVAGVVYKALSTNANKAPSSNPTYWEKCLMVAGEIAYTKAPEANGTASAGTEGKYARGDHVHPTDTSRAPLASPALTGTPTAPTAADGTNTTQIATTAFVNAEIAADRPFEATLANIKMDGAQSVGSLNTVARGDHVHPTDTSRAPLASPALTGTPTTPTAADGTNTAQIASTAFVQSAVGGYLSKSVTGGTVTLSDLEASNPVIGFSGTLTSNLVVVVPTTVKRLWAIYNATGGAFTLTVKTATGSGVTVAQGKRNLVYTDGTNVYDGFNDFENIALTGAPTAPTAAVGTNTTQIATTGFVNAEIAADRPFETTVSNIKMDGAQSVGSLNTVARGDHVHPTDTSRAPLASPALTGIPTAPTAALGENTTQLANMAAVQAEFNARMFTSAELVLAKGAQIVVSHGLAKMPRHITGWLKCVTADLGYAVGDMLMHPFDSDPDGTNEGLTVVATTSQLFVRVGEAGPAFITRKDNGSGGDLIAERWKLIIQASL